MARCETKRIEACGNQQRNDATHRPRLAAKRWFSFDEGKIICTRVAYYKRRSTRRRTEGGSRRNCFRAHVHSTRRVWKISDAIYMYAVYAMLLGLNGFGENCACASNGLSSHLAKHLRVVVPEFHTMHTNIFLCAHSHTLTHVEKKTSFHALPRNFLFFEA